MKKLVQNKVFKVQGYKKGVDKKTKNRLCEFGFVEGTTFRIVFRSMLGSNVIVELRGYVLSLKASFLDFLVVA